MAALEEEAGAEDVTIAMEEALFPKDMAAQAAAASSIALGVV